MISMQEQIQSEWNTINSDFLKALSEHFETDWPDDKKEIISYISMLPVFHAF